MLRKQNDANPDKKLRTLMDEKIFETDKNLMDSGLRF